MEEILISKFDQNSDFKDKLKESSKNTIFADTTYDMEWGTGLNKTESVKTKSSSWPGQNIMGKIVKKVAVAMCTKRRQSSVSKLKKDATKTGKQKDISIMLKEIRDNQETEDNGSMSDISSDSV